MTPGQIQLIVYRSLLHERTHREIQNSETINCNVSILFQLMVGDAAAVFPDADHTAIFDQSPFILDYVDKICAQSDHRSAKEFIVDLGYLGFYNLHYNLVCKWHQAFSKYEFQKLQEEARNLMVLIR